MNNPMSTSEIVEAIQDAVEVLSENAWRGDLQDTLKQAIAALQAQGTEPVAWGAFLYRSGELYAHCRTEQQIDTYIIQAEQSNDSLTLKKGPLYTAPPAQAARVPEGWCLIPLEAMNEFIAGEQAQTIGMAYRHLVDGLKLIATREAPATVAPAPAEKTMPDGWIVTTVYGPESKNERVCVDQQEMEDAAKAINVSAKPFKFITTASAEMANPVPGELETLTVSKKLPDAVYREAMRHIDEVGTPCRCGNITALFSWDDEDNESCPALAAYLQDEFNTFKCYLSSSAPATPQEGQDNG